MGAGALALVTAMVVGGRRRRRRMPLGRGMA
jgi:hypothetical protein